MPRKRHSIASSEAIVITEPVAMEDLEDTVVEDYKKLSEKCDEVISKIKDRKGQAKKKKN